MAAGGHFLSDVLWSGILSYAVCALIYRPLVGKWEDRPDAQVPEFFLLDYWRNLPKSARPWFFSGLAVLLSLAASLATPHKTQRELDIPLSGLGADLSIKAMVGDVVLRQGAKLSDVAQVRLKFKGFGFPTSTIEGIFKSESNAFTVSEKGMFTDIEGQLELTLPKNFQGNLVVTAEKGAIFLASDRAGQWRLEAAKGVFDDPATHRRFR